MTSIRAPMESNQYRRGILESEDREPQITFGAKNSTFQGRYRERPWQPGGKQVQGRQPERKENTA